MDLQPKIFHSQGEVPSTAVFVDAFTGSIDELFFIDNPQLKKPDPATKEALEKFRQAYKADPVWIYYPAANIAVKSVSEEDFFKLRTARNKNIISEAEQNAYRQVKVGVAGLSVGSSAVNAMAMSGGPQYIRIADFDTIEVTNLNRLRARLSDVGQNKTDVAARGVWDLDPFAKLDLWPKGIALETIEEFLINEPKLDIFVDEMDSIPVKIAARIFARKHKIPVIMATDNGDSVIVDVERFDTEPDRKLFHGLIEEWKPEDLATIDFKTWLQLATQIVGPEWLTTPMQESILSIGKTIASVPQLGTTAAMAGSAIAFVIRKIANKEPMPSGRYSLGLDATLIPDYNSEENVKIRKQKTEEFKTSFGPKPNA